MRCVRLDSEWCVHVARLRACANTFIATDGLIMPSVTCACRSASQARQAARASERTQRATRNAPSHPARPSARCPPSSRDTVAPPFGGAASTSRQVQQGVPRRRARGRGGGLHALRRSAPHVGARWHNRMTQNWCACLQAGAAPDVTHSVLACAATVSGGGRALLFLAA